MKNTSADVTFSSISQDKDNSELLEMTTDSLAQWRNNLTLSDIGVAAKKMYLVLHDMHTIKLDPALRLELLELLRPTVSFICTHLSKKIYEDAHLVATKKNKIALLIQTLQLEAAEGYRITIDHLATQKTQKKLLLTAIYRLMTFQFKILTASYQLYASPPQGLWLEMHRLYQFSEQNGLATKSISQNNVVQIRHKSILDAYKHCLLMGISDSFRLSQKEIQQLNYLLEDWIKYVTLKSISHVGNEFIVINPNQDTGPLYNQDIQSDSTHTHLMALDLEKLVTYLEKVIALKDSPAAHTEAQLSALESMINPILLEKLYFSWTQRPKRSKDRVEPKSHNKIKVSIGLSSIHYFIGQQLKHTHETDVDADNDEIIMSSDHITTDNIPMNSYHCDIIDASPGGFRLAWEDNPPQEINALELIGLEFITEDKNSFWLVGSIQWLKQDEGKLHIGVKILSPYAKPVKIQLYDAEEGARSKLMSALLLPELPHLKQPQTLIAPYLPFKEGSKISMSVDGEEIYGDLKTNVLKAHHYKQFTLEYDTATPHLDFGPFKIGDQDTEAVWSSLYKL